MACNRGLGTLSRALIPLPVGPPNPLNITPVSCYFVEKMEAVPLCICSLETESLSALPLIRRCNRGVSFHACPTPSDTLTLKEQQGAAVMLSSQKHSKIVNPIGMVPSSHTKLLLICGTKTEIRASLPCSYVSLKLVPHLFKKKKKNLKY